MCTQTQLKKISDEILINIRNILGDKLRSIILYGSYARGDFDDESDIDIMVLADMTDGMELKNAERKIDKFSSGLSLDNGITVCILLYDNLFFESHLHISPFYRNIRNEGVIIYAN